MKIILYTIGCPQCKMLEMNLNKKNIQYEECRDIEKMMELGIKHAPALDVDGKLMGVQDALKWVKSV